MTDEIKIGKKQPRIEDPLSSDRYYDDNRRHSSGAPNQGYGDRENNRSHDRGDYSRQERRRSSDPYDRPFPSREGRQQQQQQQRTDYSQGNFRGRGRYGGGRGGRGRGRDTTVSAANRGGEQHQQRVPKIPGNVVERSTIIQLAPEVAMTKDLLKSVMEYKDAELASNLKQIAHVLVESRDLEGLHAEDTADLFVKFLTLLSVECSTTATLLALISKAQRQFPIRVIEKLIGVLIEALSEDDVLLSKLCLRAVSVLVSCKALNPEFLIKILTPMVAVIETYDSNPSVSNFSPSDVNARVGVCAYLLASTLPWCIMTMSEHTGGGIAFAKKCASVLRAFTEKYRSPFDMNQANAIFLENSWSDIGDQSKGSEDDSKPKDAACWDSIWSAAHSTCGMCNQYGSSIRDTMRLVP